MNLPRERSNLMRVVSTVNSPTTANGSKNNGSAPAPAAATAAHSNGNHQVNGALREVKSSENGINISHEEAAQCLAVPPGESGTHCLNSQRSKSLQFLQIVRMTSSSDSCQSLPRCSPPEIELRCPIQNGSGGNANNVRSENQH